MTQTLAATIRAKVAQAAGPKCLVTGKQHNLMQMAAVNLDGEVRRACRQCEWDYSFSRREWTWQGAGPEPKP